MCLDLIKRIRYRTVRIPGLIDVHVHVRDLGESHKEDWGTCTQSALAGGITMICAMPNTVPPFVDWDSFSLTVEEARKKAVCDYGLIIGASNSNSKTSVGVTSAVAKNCGTAAVGCHSLGLRFFSQAFRRLGRMSVALLGT